MKFGAVPLHEALGGILAHSHPVPHGRLRKGCVLTELEIEQLDAAGAETVVIARLEAGDAGEDEAAAALGAALLQGADGLHATPARTGRVNLIADGPGLIDLNADAIEAVNLISPLISLATVPPHFQMRAGGMAGTVKIISYGVPRADLERACAAAAGAVRLVRPKRLNARLILTHLGEAQDDSKAIAATRARLEALDSELSDVVRTAHDTSALADAIGASRDADLVLILTVSATSDPYDVGPQALRDAGGTVERFGMPVDPGNLLFLGDMQGKPVVGLPGCARSPALNGADLVLGRVLCGMPVTSGDIAAMGVGGLLKEIPTRPSPRRNS